MEMREYLDILAEQIRCRAARPAVEEEIRRHIEDQAECYAAGGYSREEALRMAVEQMGDPVEAGVGLDRIHRPKTDWRMILLIFILSLAGLGLFGAIAASTGNWYMFYRRVVFTVLGFLVMCVVYRMDYSALGKYPVVIWLGVCFLLMLFAFCGKRVNGQVRIYNLLLLSIPLYAGVLYSMRNGGFGSVLLCAAFILFPALPAARAVQSTAMIEIVACCSLLLFAAVLKGWFHVKRGITLAGLAGGMAAVPVFLIFFGEKSGLLLPYQSARIQAFLHMGKYQTSANYLRAETMRLAGDYTLFGSHTLPPDSLALSKTLESDYAVTALFYYYGILAGCLVLLLMAWLLVRSCTVCMRQKNKLGMMVGLSCVLALGIQTVTYVLSNFGIGLLSQRTMPFFSSGGQGTVVNFIFLGLLLSIYRYKDVLPAETEKGNRKIVWRKPWTVAS